MNSYLDTSARTPKEEEPIGESVLQGFSVHKLKYKKAKQEAIRKTLVLILTPCFILTNFLLNDCIVQAQSNKSSRNFLKTQGEKLISERKYTEAAEFYLKEIKKNPKDVTAQYNLAILYYDAQKFDEALRHIEAAINIKPEFPRAWFMKGEILIKKERYRSEEDTAILAKIIECFDNALTMEKYSLPPSRSMKTIAWSWKSSLLLQQDIKKKNFDGVMHCLNNALSLSNDYTAALLLFKKGFFQYHYSRYDNSLRSLDSAISKLDEISNEQVSFNSHEAMIHNMKGIIYYKQKRFQQALQEYNQAISKLGSSSEPIDLLFLQGVYSNKGLLYTSNSQFQDALDVYNNINTIVKKRAVLGYPPPRNIWLNPALTLYRMGKKQEAFNRAFGHQIPYEGIRFLFNKSKIYLVYRGAPEFSAIYFLSSPLDLPLQVKGIKGKRPIELSSMIYLDSIAVVTHLDDLILPLGSITLSVPEKTPIRVAEKEQKDERKYKLFVYTEPYNANVKILNIKYTFKQGVELKPGKYLVEVTKNGYKIKKQWIEIKESDLSINIELRKEKDIFIDVLVEGIDDGVKTSKQQDRDEALIDAKRQAIERAGVDVEAITIVEDFELKKDWIESKAKAILMPGFQIIDKGYQNDGFYLVILSGKVKSIP